MQQYTTLRAAYVNIA